MESVEMKILVKILLQFIKTFRGMFVFDKNDFSLKKFWNGTPQYCDIPLLPMEIINKIKYKFYFFLCQTHYLTAYCNGLEY